MPSPLAPARAALALLALALALPAAAEERRAAASAGKAPGVQAAARQAGASGLPPVLSPWAGVAPDLGEAHRVWSWVDGPIDGNPRRPALVRHLTEEEERRLIRRDWR